MNESFIDLPTISHPLKYKLLINYYSAYALKPFWKSSKQQSSTFTHNSNTKLIKPNHLTYIFNLSAAFGKLALYCGRKLFDLVNVEIDM